MRGFLVMYGNHDGMSISTSGGNICSTDGEVAGSEFLGPRSA